MSPFSYRQLLIRFVLLLSFVAASGSHGAQAQTVPPQDCKPSDASAAGEGRALALLIGIGKYPTTGNVTDIHQLNGPPNDVEIMHDMLVKKGFEQGNIKTLRESQATRAAIIAAFCDHLVKPARAQDSILFYFSGHGSRTGDQEPFDEPDGFDETIVAYDSRQPGVVDIRDDELQALVKQLPTNNVVLILDSCNSGTTSRDAFAVSREIEADPRYPARPGVAVLNNGGFASDTARFVLLAGTRSDLKSYETAFTRGDQSFTFGAFTYHLVRQLEAANKDTTYREVFEQVVPQVRALFSLQEPQLEGTNINNILFKNINVLATPYSEITEISDDKTSVAMNAGAVHDVTKGSRYDVFPPATREFSADKKIASIEVVEAGPLRSIAKVVGGAVDKPIEPGSRAVERVHRFSGRPLRVATGTDRAFTQAIKDALGTAANRVEFVTADPAAALALSKIDAKGNEPEQITWRSPDGALTSSPVPLNSPTAAKEIAEQLHRWTRWFALQRLKNSRSKLKVSMWLTKVGGAEANGELRLKVGEKLQISVQNNSDDALFIHVIDLASDGTISLVFPEDGRQEQISSGATWRSREYPARLEGNAVQVSDTARVILATSPIPLDLILLPATKSLADIRSKSIGGMSELAKLFASSGVEARAIGSVDADDWITKDRRLRVEK